MDYRYKIIVTFEDGQSTVIDQDEIDALEVNLEHGYDVDGFIVEALRAREPRSVE